MKKIKFQTIDLSSIWEYQMPNNFIYSQVPTVHCFRLWTAIGGLLWRVVYEKY